MEGELCSTLFPGQEWLQGGHRRCFIDLIWWHLRVHITSVCRLMDEALAGSTLSELQCWRSHRCTIPWNACWRRQSWAGRMRSQDAPQLRKSVSCGWYCCYSQTSQSHRNRCCVDTILQDGTHDDGKHWLPGTNGWSDRTFVSVSMSLSQQKWCPITSLIASARDLESWHHRIYDAACKLCSCRSDHSQSES